MEAGRQHATCQRQSVLAGCGNASKAAVLPQQSVTNLFIPMVSVAPHRIPSMGREVSPLGNGDQLRRPEMHNAAKRKYDRSAAVHIEAGPSKSPAPDMSAREAPRFNDHRARM